ncbi:porin family protein [Stenotrophomonas maltophilia]|uniref:outer membrane protein n=1 Tax=Stenotrophomonas maltophilia group TaxID=995085 RepID=UPI000D42F7B9|nr:outer membrane beta-barrel protein [Stenotrophomonas maltophilia]MCF3498184.1 outer membrane beta-barrel protein [Stenotrophomonas maltophilia]PSD21404.1 porin family protein [Stenotrophomonas maltophilia]UGB23616.1 outer membrane beta-barrel protein [Stenotrophomonas maltophilia]
MKTPILVLALATASALPQVALAEAADGYYATVRIIDADHRARNMDASARPGVGRFIAGDEHQRFVTGAIGVGYAHGNGWRTEGEYTLRRSDTYTSGSSLFASSFNNHDVTSQRLMANAYRDFAINGAWSLYASAGAGLAQLKSGGWQGNESRRYGSTTRVGLAWSVGAGVSVAASDRMHIDLGYRYVDMGSTESGWNTFGNARGLQDEKMKLDLASSELHLGARLAF